MKVYNETLNFLTKGAIDFVDLTDKVQQIVAKSGVKNGLVHLFAPHATGIIILTEYEPALVEDIKTFLEQLVSSRERFHHPSNAHAHLRSVLLPPDKTIPIINGRAVFGTWQSVIFVETDVYSRQRTIIVQAIGE
ncbi:MAG: secondary thiamine-phosphate synthase enzyme YjbQ [Candidatus Bathyarchaeales archaeon]